MSQIIPLFKRMDSKKPENNGEGRIEKFFTFIISGKSLAIPAVDVSEVAAYSSVVDIPKTNDIISGVVNVRGNVIPIINIRKRLNLSTDYSINEKTKILYFKIRQDFFVGMIVDDIDFRLVEGIILPQSDSTDNIFKTVMREKNKDCNIPVFFIDDYIESSEFEDIRKVLDSF
jgi:purine-binding chemotaxis protein CheW